MKSPLTGRDMAIKTEKREMTFRKKSFVIDFHFYQDDETGEEFTDEKLGDLNINQLFNQYRAKYNLPFPDEIIELRERYGLSAAKLSEALGFGANVYRNYENGEIPSESNARLIQLAKDAVEFKKLIKLSVGFEGKELARINNRLDELIAEKESLLHFDFEELLIGEKVASEFTGYKVPNLVKATGMIVYFTEKMNENGELWKTQLNKLMFYSDFCHYKSTGHSISGLQYRAIQRGPVPSSFGALYEHAAKDYVDINYYESEDGNRSGEKFTPNHKHKFNPDLFTVSEMKTLECVAETFLRTSTKDIVRLSHEEDAWIENEGDKKIISYNKAFTLKNIKL